MTLKSLLVISLFSNIHQWGKNYFNIQFKTKSFNENVNRVCSYLNNICFLYPEDNPTVNPFLFQPNAFLESSIQKEDHFFSKTKILQNTKEKSKIGFLIQQWEDSWKNPTLQILTLTLIQYDVLQTKVIEFISRLLNYFR